MTDYEYQMTSFDVHVDHKVFIKWIIIIIYKGNFVPIWNYQNQIVKIVKT